MIKKRRMSTTSMVLWIMGMVYGGVLAIIGIGMMFMAPCWIFKVLGVAFAVTGIGVAIISKHFST